MLANEIRPGVCECTDDEGNKYRARYASDGHLRRITRWYMPTGPVYALDEGARLVEQLDEVAWPVMAESGRDRELAELWEVTT